MINEDLENMNVDAFLSGSDMVSESENPVIKADDIPGMPKTPKVKKSWKEKRAEEEAKMYGDNRKIEFQMHNHDFKA